MSLYIRNQEKPVQNSKALLEKLAGLLPAPEKPQRYNHYNPGRFDLEEWLNRYGLRYQKSDYGGGTKFILEHCPFDESHTGKDACIFQMSNGAIGFHCFTIRVPIKPGRMSGGCTNRMPMTGSTLEERPRPNYRNPDYVVEKVEQVKFVEGQPVFFTTDKSA